MRRFPLFLFGLLGLWALAAKADTEEARKAALDSVVRIEADGRFGGGLVLHKVGTGLVVVTAAHVVEGAEVVRVQLRTHPGVDLDATVIERLVDRQTDVAILRVSLSEALVPSAEGLGALDTAVALPRSKVRLVGQPSYQPWFASPSVEVQKIDATSLRVHYRCDHGMSGGGVYDEGWRLVGMTLRRFTSQVCEAVPAARLSLILGDWGLTLDWEEDDAQVNSRSKEAWTVVVAPLVTATEGVVERRQKNELPDARRMAALLSSASGPSLWFVDSGVERPRLTVELVSYHEHSIHASAYHSSIETDIFAATFRVALRSWEGELLFNKEYPRIEVVDYQRQHGLSQFGKPPFAELVIALSEVIAEEILITLAARRK